LQKPERKQQGKRGRKRIEGQKEMLFPIAGAGKGRNPARSVSGAEKGWLIGNGS
jgi:hypothetical protein